MVKGPVYPNASTPSTIKKGAPPVDCTTGCLFDILKDPHEIVDLAATLPAVKASLMARYVVLNATT